MFWPGTHLVVPDLYEASRIIVSSRILGVGCQQELWILVRLALVNLLLRDTYMRREVNVANHAFLAPSLIPELM